MDVDWLSCSPPPPVESDEPADEPDALDSSLSPPLPAPAAAPKKSRRAVQKRIVSVPLADVAAGGKGAGAAGEGLTPPPDSWAWRKYGQKPIKGSPYPRGYYRCSSSRGCPAKKQVERSRADPAMLVVTYSFDHNHAWTSAPARAHSYAGAAAPKGKARAPKREASVEKLLAVTAVAADSGDHDEQSAILKVEVEDPFHWFDDVSSPATSGSPTGADAMLLYTAPFADVSLLDAPGGGGEDDALFGDLGELPECAVVFRRAATVLAG